jgi:pSer/pThr/pTyr-binding forkhead associated (FHA) protein
MEWLVAMTGLALICVSGLMLWRRNPVQIKTLMTWCKARLLDASSLDAISATAAIVVIEALPRLGPDERGGGGVDLLLPSREWGLVRTCLGDVNKAILARVAELGVQTAPLHLRIFPGQVEVITAVRSAPSRRTRSALDGVSDPIKVEDPAPPDLLVQFSRGGVVALSIGETCVFGSAPEGENDLTITDDDLISSSHLVVEVSERYATITDLASTNGTYVNDQRISTHRLRLGDEVLLGRTRFVVKSLSQGFEPSFTVAGGEDALAELGDGFLGASPDGVGIQEDHPEGRSHSATEDGLPLAHDLRGTSASRADTPSRSTAPMRTSMAPPLLGESLGHSIVWQIDDGTLRNLNLVLLGASDTGKTQLAAAVVSQLDPATRVFVADLKGEYAVMDLPSVTVLDPWARTLRFNPLLPTDPAASRGGERLVIEVRDALAAACSSRSRLVNHQVTRLERALAEVVSTGGGMSDLSRVLDDDLLAIFGDLFGSRLFGTGPPLGELLHERSLLDLSSIPGDGMTSEMVGALALVGLEEQVRVEPEASEACRFMVLVDPADHLAHQRALNVIAREGGSRGLGLIVATQRPEVLPGDLVAQAGMVACFRLGGEAASIAATRLGGSSTLAERIRRLAQGHAIVRQGEAAPIELRAVQYHELAEPAYR